MLFELVYTNSYVKNKASNIKEVVVEKYDELRTQNKASANQ